MSDMTLRQRLRAMFWCSWRGHEHDGRLAARCIDCGRRLVGLDEIQCGACGHLHAGDGRCQTWYGEAACCNCPVVYPAASSAQSEEE